MVWGGGGLCSTNIIEYALLYWDLDFDSQMLSNWGKVEPGFGIYIEDFEKNNVEKNPWKMAFLPWKTLKKV